MRGAAGECRWLGGLQDAEVSSTSHFGPHAHGFGIHGGARGSSGLAHSLRESLEVIGGRQQRVGVRGEAQDFPSSGRRQAFAVCLAQVVAMRLGERRERAEHCRRVCVDVGQGGDRRSATRRTRTAPNQAHAAGTYPLVSGRHRRRAATLPRGDSSRVEGLRSTGATAQRHPTCPASGPTTRPPRSRPAWPHRPPSAACGAYARRALRRRRG